MNENTLTTRNIWLIALLMAVLFLPARTSAQTGFFFDEFGGGYRSAAMGQAFTAVADDYSAAYYNPAGLTQVKGIFENCTGYIYTKPRVSAHFPGNTSIDSYEQPSTNGLFTGIASSLDIEETIRVFPWFKRFAFGMLTWMNIPNINQYHSGPVSSRPHFLRHDMRFQLLALTVSMGFEVTPWLSLGAGVIPSVDSKSVQNSFAATDNREDGMMGLRLSLNQKAIFRAIGVFGLLIKPPIADLQDKISLGISYRGENKAHHGKGPLAQIIGVELPGTDDYTGYPQPMGDALFAIIVPKVNIVNLVSFAPRQVTIGLACKMVKDLTLAYDMTWKQYSSFKTVLSVPPIPAFDNTCTHRFGAEYAWRPTFSTMILDSVNKICFRGGYYFEPTPVRELPSIYVEQGLASDNILDSDLNVFSTGMCITFAAETMEHDLEFFFQYHHLRSYERQSYIDGIYAYENDIAPRDEYIDAEISGYVCAVGVGYTVRF